jgi:flagellar basal-body rod protein FlgF
MNVSLYQAAAAMNAQARWQELITENLAHASVPGFRKNEISFSAISAGLDPTAPNSINSQYAIPVANSRIDLQTGELRATNNNFDFALEGPGYFEVKLPNGSRAYTRDGEFHLNATGQLVTKQGHLVMGDAGPIQFDPNDGGPLTVSPSGDVNQGGEVKGHLRMAEFNNPRELTSIGDGFYLADKTSTKPNPAITTQIRQGFLEGANTSPNTEMTSLITAMRMFEANSKVLQMQDERMGRVISDLGSPT